MRTLLQRVKKSSVEVENKTISSIDTGILIFVGIETNDTQKTADKMIDKILNYRVFSDNDDKMNLSVTDVDGAVLAVSQFTLAADTNSGLRPSFTTAAKPELSKELYDYFCLQLRSQGFKVPTGEFAADMKVKLLNDGPVTFTLTI